MTTGGTAAAIPVTLQSQPTDEQLVVIEKAFQKPTPNRWNLPLTCVDVDLWVRIRTTSVEVNIVEFSSGVRVVAEHFE